MYEFAASHAYLIPVLPLLACAIIALLGRWMKPMAHLPAIVAMIGSFVLGDGPPDRPEQRRASLKVEDLKDMGGRSYLVQHRRL